MITNRVNAIILKSNDESCYVPFSATLQWDSVDPLAVRLVCHLPDADVTWAFGRDLLFVGSTSLIPAGEGDVKFRKEGPVSSRMLACLRSSDGHADIALNRPQVVRFLNRTIAAMPIGSEALDDQIDQFIEEIYNA